MNKRVTLIFSLTLLLSLTACTKAKLDDEVVNKDEIKNEIIEGNKDEVSLVKKYNSGSYILQKDFNDYILEARINVDSSNKITGVDFNKLIKYDMWQDSLGNLYLKVDGKLDENGNVLIPETYRKLALATKDIILPTTLDAIKLDDLIVGRDEKINTLEEVSIYLSSEQLSYYALYESQMDLLSKRIIEDQNTYGIILDNSHATNVDNLVISVADEISLAEEILADINKTVDTPTRFGYYQAGTYELFSDLVYTEEGFTNYHLYLLVDKNGAISSFKIETINGKSQIDLDKLSDLISLNGSLAALNFTNARGEELSLKEVLEKDNDKYKVEAYLEGFDTPINYYIDLINKLFLQVRVIPLADGTYRVNSDDAYLTVTIEKGLIKDIIYDSFEAMDGTIVKDGSEYPLYTYDKTYLDSSLDEKLDKLYVYLKNGKYYYAKDYLEFGFKDNEEAKLSLDEEATLVRSTSIVKKSAVDFSKILETKNPYSLDLSVQENLDFSNLLNEALRTSLNQEKRFELTSFDLGTTKTFASSSFSAISPFKTSKGYPYLQISFEGSRAKINIDYLDIVDGKVIFNDNYEKDSKDKTNIELSNEYLKKNLSLNLTDALRRYDYKQKTEVKNTLDSNSELYDDFGMLFDQVFKEALDARVIEVRDKALEVLSNATDYHKKNYIVNLENRTLNEKLGIIIEFDNVVSGDITLDFDLTTDNSSIRIEELSSTGGKQRFKIYAKTDFKGLENVKLDLEVKFKDFDDLTVSKTVVSCDLPTYASFLIDEFNTFGEVNNLVSTKESKNIYEIYIPKGETLDIKLDKDYLFDLIIDYIPSGTLDTSSKNALKAELKDYVSRFVILDYSDAMNHLESANRDGKDYYVYTKRGDVTSPLMSGITHNKKRNELSIKNSDLEVQETLIKLKDNTSDKPYEVKLRLYIDTMHEDNVLDLYDQQFNGTWQVGEPYIDITLRVLAEKQVKEVVSTKLDLSNMVGKAYQDTYYELINLADLRINGLDLNYYGRYNEQNSSNKYSFNYINQVSFAEFSSYFKEQVINGEKVLKFDQKNFINSYDLTYINEKDVLSSKKINLPATSVKVVAEFNYLDNGVKRAIAIIEYLDKDEANPYFKINFYTVKDNGELTLIQDKSELTLTTGEKVKLPSLYRIYDKLKKQVMVPVDGSISNEEGNLSESTTGDIVITTLSDTPTTPGLTYKEETVYEAKSLKERYSFLESNFREIANFMAKMPFVIDDDKLYIRSLEDKIYDAKMFVEVVDSASNELLSKTTSLETVASSKKKLELNLLSELENVDLLVNDNVNGIPLVVRFSDLDKEKNRTFSDIFSDLNKISITIRDDLGHTLNKNMKLIDAVKDQIVPSKVNGDTEDIMFTINAFYEDSKRNIIEAESVIKFKLIIDQNWH